MSKLADKLEGMTIFVIRKDRGIALGPIERIGENGNGWARKRILVRRNAKGNWVPV